MACILTQQIMCVFAGLAWRPCVRVLCMCGVQSIDAQTTCVPHTRRVWVKLAALGGVFQTDAPGKAPVFYTLIPSLHA